MQSQHLTHLLFFLSSELAESYFILWRTTKDQKYRDYAWQFAQTIAQYCRFPTVPGFAMVRALDPARKVTSIDNQRTHFLNAALLYLYLIFSDDNELPLDQWVFNAGQNPLPICGKNSAYPAEKC